VKDKGIQRSRSLVGGSLGNDVLHRLREDIVSCVLSPGERLRFEALREIYGASFSTLREALFRLVQEQLVISENQRGFAVAPISREDLLDLTEVRVLIEKECVTRAIARIDASRRSRILSTFHRLDRIEGEYDGHAIPRGDWEAVHAEFHEALVDACDSPTLMGIRHSLFDRARRYRKFSALTRKMPRAKSAEHRSLMEAVLSRDLGSAQQLIEVHVRATTENVLDGLTEANALAVV
jgi:GntR family transcriptional regulator, carbon starvation induced regulator